MQESGGNQMADVVQRRMWNSEGMISCHDQLPGPIQSGTKRLASLCPLPTSLRMQREVWHSWGWPMAFTTHWITGITACIWKPEITLGIRSGAGLMEKEITSTRGIQYGLPISPIVCNTEKQGEIGTRPRRRYERTRQKVSRGG